MNMITASCLSVPAKVPGKQPLGKTSDVVRLLSTPSVVKRKANPLNRSVSGGFVYVLKGAIFHGSLQAIYRLLLNSKFFRQALTQ